MKYSENRYFVPTIIMVVLITMVGVSMVYAGGNDDKVQGGKTSCSYSGTAYLPSPEVASLNGDFTEQVVAEAQIKTGNHSDIVIMFTAEATLVTDTKITGEKDPGTGKPAKVSDTDIATITVWAEVDGVKAEPGNITFAHRLQTLSGKLNMQYNHTADAWTEEGQEIELLLNTTNANGFNFLALDLGKGIHTVKIYAVVATFEEGQQPDTIDDVFGGIGKRTLVIDEVRMVQSNGQ